MSKLKTNSARSCASSLYVLPKSSSSNLTEEVELLVSLRKSMESMEKLFRERVQEVADRIALQSGGHLEGTVSEDGSIVLRFPKEGDRP